jgi:hypothetical protein
MKIALVHNHFDVEHLETVKNEMLKLGAPKIKAVWMEVYDCYAALEGCHRIRGAKELGLTIEIEEVEYSNEIAFDDFTVSQIADDCFNSEMVEF